MRRLLVTSVASLLFSCTTPAPLELSSHPPSRLPALDGRPELISTLDVYAIISELRRHLGSSTRVFRITVDSPNRVGAYNGSPDTYDGMTPSIFYCAVVERRGGQWHFIDNYFAGGAFVD